MDHILGTAACNQFGGRECRRCRIFEVGHKSILERALQIWRSARYLRTRT